MQTHPIKTRADGSIDTAFYMARGRRERSTAAHLGLRSLRTAIATAIHRIFAGKPRNTETPAPEVVAPLVRQPLDLPRKTAA